MYMKVQWMYLYCSFNSEVSTIDFYPSESGDKQAAKCFFKKALAFSYMTKPCVITVDKSPTYSVVINDGKPLLTGAGSLSE